ncbi:MAG: pyridoxal phosphate-dependent aminotransferase, partial [Gammaproteobacteria bacterium]
AFPDFSALGIPSETLAQRLLHEAGVATEAGAFYGPSGEGHLRICFGAVEYPRLEEAMDRIEHWLQAMA